MQKTYYKVISQKAEQKGFHWVINKKAMENELNRLAELGWELDSTSNFASGGTTMELVMVLRNTRLPEFED